MNPILPTEETTEYEDRLYLNPQIGVDESNQFIEKLRETQNNNVAQIKTQTQNLGTDVPSILGGLAGGTGYWTSRYQTPQTNAAVSDLRAAAQATALNQALANEEAMWKKRYQEAYRNYQSRAWDKQNNAENDKEGEPETEETTKEVTVAPEALADQLYKKKLQEYIDKGYSASEAGIRAKVDLGLGTLPEILPRVKSTVGGNNAYVYTLPNGNRVLVKEDQDELILIEGGYALRNKETGRIVKVGGAATGGGE